MAIRTSTCVPSRCITQQTQVTAAPIVSCTWIEGYGAIISVSNFHIQALCKHEQSSILRPRYYTKSPTEQDAVCPVSCSFINCTGMTRGWRLQAHEVRWLALVKIIQCGSAILKATSLCATVLLICKTVAMSDCNDYECTNVHAEAPEVYTKNDMNQYLHSRIEGYAYLTF